MARRNTNGLPPLPANDALGFNSAFQQLYAQYRDQLGALQSQGTQIQGAFNTQASAIDQQLQQDLSYAEGAAVDRGILGSSTDFKGRTQVRANSASAMAQAINARNQALLQNKQAAIGAARDFQLGTVNLQMSRAAEQAMQTAQAFAENSFLTPDGAGSGTSALTAGQRRGFQNSRDSIKNLLTQIAVQGPSDNLMSQLQTVWAQRNKFRQLMGLIPLTNYDMEQAIYQARQKYGHPGRMV